MGFLILLRRKERVCEQPGPDTINFLCQVQSYLFQMLCVMQHFVHGLGIESAEYLDMTFGGVFVHCMAEEGKSILDRILSITLLEDLQIKALLISEDEPIITYPNTSDISALPDREELLQLTTSGIGSENEIEDPTPVPLSIEEDCFDDDIGNS
jgi:hypothetical protein